MAANGAQKIFFFFFDNCVFSISPINIYTAILIVYIFTPEIEVTLFEFLTWNIGDWYFFWV